MWPIPNPLLLFGIVLGGTVGWAWQKVIAGVYTWFASGVLMLMEWVWTVLESATTPRLTEDWFASGLIAPLAAISLSIIVALMLASAIQAGFGGRPELIVDALKEGPKAIVATAITLVVMDVLIRGADALAEVAWLAGREDTVAVMDSLAATMIQAGGLAGTFLGPLALLFGMIGLLVTAVVLFMRSALLYLVAGFAPIVWAASVSPVMRGAARRLVHVTVALVLAKPAITVSLAVGVKLMANAGVTTPDAESADGASALGTLVTGFACFAIAGLSPWVVYRLLPSVEQASVSSGIVGGWGRTAMTGVHAGLMVKSLGASGAASAATRSIGSGASTLGGSSGGGGGGGGGGSSPGPAATGTVSTSSQASAATSPTRRPRLDPPPGDSSVASSSGSPGGEAR